MLFDPLEEEEEEDFFSTEDEVAEEPQSLQPPRSQSYLIGHEEIEQKLLALFKSERHPHAIIFAGPQGIGKSTMAFRLARHLLKTSEDEYSNALQGPSMFGDVPTESKDLFVDSKDPVFSKVAAGGHPDLLTIERLYDEKKDRRKTEVSVDEIRKIAPFMRKTPAVDGGWRIVIVDDADTMNRNSQNSILKILEEPPEKALLILITHRLGALLPTILSRASVQNFYSLSDSLLQTELTRINPKLSAGDKNLIIAMSEGSLGKAIEYSDEKNFSVIQKSFELLKAWPQFDWSAIQHFADSLGKGASLEAQFSFQNSFLWLCASLAKSKAAEIKLSPELEPFYGLQEQVSLAGWLQICDILREHFTRVQIGNLDKRFMVMGAFTVFENNV